MTTSSSNGSALEAQLDALSAAEGDVDGEQLLLLWFLRNVLSVDDLDSYEFMLGDHGAWRFDGFHLEPGADADTPARLMLIEVKRPQQPVSADQVRTFVEGTAELWERHDVWTVDELPPDMVASLRKTAGARRGRLLPAGAVLHLAFVSDQALADDAEEYVARLNASQPALLSVFAGEHLQRIARAVDRPALVDTQITLDIDDREALEADLTETTALVCPVSAVDIVEWPGIEDRTLFDLNVRFALPKGRVRDSLDTAIRRVDDHGDFLAFHNGLTVLCRRHEYTNGTVRIEGLSVVNGAQTVLAFYANREYLTEHLRVLVKFVAVEADSAIAREVAIRSNTQNPVSSRNLRALDPQQLRIEQEFIESYSRYRYETRPDAARRPDEWTIANDYAAQLLCAVYNEMPWLAVKRDTLFSPRVYPTIFRPTIGAPEVLLCHNIRLAVEAHRPTFPDTYRTSWRLTALVAVYLVGQLLRVNDEFQQLLDYPEQSLDDHGRLDEPLGAMADVAAATLSAHRDEMAASGEPDDFKVDFKRENFLRNLAAQAVDRFAAV